MSNSEDGKHAGVPQHSAPYQTNKYKFIRDSMTGGGGYQDASYLIPYPLEHADDYALRKARFYYPNFFLPIMLSYRDPLFRQEPTRSGSLTKYAPYIDWVKRVNGLGMNLTQFMKRACLLTKSQEMTAIVIEPPLNSLNKSVQDDINAGNMPSLRLLNPDDIIDYEVDVEGKLLMIRYRRQSGYKKLSGLMTEEVTLTRDTWTFGDKPPMPATTSEIPVIPYYAGENEEACFVPQPTSLSMAMMCHRNANLKSEISNLEIGQTFSILVVPSSMVNSKGGLSAGVGGYLSEPSNLQGGKGVRFESPDGSQLTNLYQGSKDLISELYSTARLSHMHQGAYLNTSGESKKADQEVTSQAISSLAVNTSHVEVRIGKIIAEYFGRVELADDYIVNYPTRFNMSDVESTLTNSILSIDGLDFGVTANTKIAKHAYNAIGISTTPEEQKTIDSEIDANYQLKEQQKEIIPIDINIED